MNRMRANSTIASLKLVIAAPPQLDLAAFLGGLVTQWPDAFIRDYQLGTSDALRLESRCSPAGVSSQTSRISVYALLNQEHYAALQDVLLSNADGILLILDMRPSQRSASVQMVLQTTQSLRRQGLDIHQIPVVLLYHHAELVTTEMLLEWDQLLDWERLAIPRYLSATNDQQSIAQAFEGLLQRVKEAAQVRDE